MPEKSIVSRIFLVIVFIGLALLLLRELRLRPDGRLHAYFLDVGQGDSILLVTPSGKQILVDGGPDLKTLEHLGRLLPFFDRSLDLVVMTHPNLDHLAVFPEVLRRYHVDRFLLTGIAFDLPRYDAILAELKELRTQRSFADPATNIDMGDGVILDIIWPPRDVFGHKFSEINDVAVVLRVVHASGSILLTGDIEEKAEEAILKTGAGIRSTVLKVAHHGSKTSSSTGFLLAVMPSLAVISLGAENTYGHPHAVTLDRLKTLNIPVRRTDLEGTVEITFP